MVGSATWWRREVLNASLGSSRPPLSAGGAEVDGSRKFMAADGHFTGVSGDRLTLSPQGSDRETFGRRLAATRKSTGHSQLSLSLEAGISSRHLGFLELGRSRPSEEMVLKLAAALHLERSDEDRLMIAAGFVPNHIRPLALEAGFAAAGSLGAVAFDAAVQLDAASSREAAWEIAARFLDRIGIQYFITGVLKPDGKAWTICRDPGGRPASGWIRHMEVQNHGERDPLVPETASRSAGFFWEDVPRGRMTADSRAILDEAADFRIGNGFIMPIRRGDGSVRALSSWGERVDTSAPARIAAGLVATSLLGALDRLAGKDTGLVSAPVRLSPIHRDILEDIAVGKSISNLRIHRSHQESDIRRHVRQAAQVMGTHDPRTAAARAMRYGLITG